MSLENAESQNRQAASDLEKRIDAVGATANEARSKYAYFLLAAAGAALGYGLQKLDGQSRNWITGLAVLANVCWVASIFLGCLALENAHLTHNYVIKGYHLQRMILKRGIEPNTATKLEGEVEQRFDKARSAHSWQRDWQFYLLISGVLIFAAWRFITWWHQPVALPDCQNSPAGSAWTSQLKIITSPTSLVFAPPPTV